MPDLGNHPLSASLSLAHCSTVKPPDAAITAVVPDAAVNDSDCATTVEALLPNYFGSENGGDARVLKRCRGSVQKTGNGKDLFDRLTDPFSLPFLVGAPKLV